MKRRNFVFSVYALLLCVAVVNVQDLPEAVEVETDPEHSLLLCSESYADPNDTFVIHSNMTNTRFENYTFTLTVNGTPNCPLEDLYNQTFRLNETNYYWFTVEGILVLKDDEKSITKYRKSTDYCVQSWEEDALTLSICEIKCGRGSNRPCIHKCCGDADWILSMDYTDNVCGGEIQCVDSRKYHKSSSGISFLMETLDHPHSPFGNIMGSPRYHSPVNPNYLTNEFKDNLVFDKVYQHLLEVPSHRGGYNGEFSPVIFHINENGFLEFPSKEEGKWTVITDPFCIDAIENYGWRDNSSGASITLAVFQYANHTEDDHAVHEGESMTAEDVRTTILYSVLMPSASTFLLLVIIVKILLWDKQNLHGQTIFTYVVSCFFLYLFLSLYDTIDVDTGSCKFVAVASHFFMLSTFTWLTTINFDIWYKFRKLQVSTGTKSLKQYIFYAVFAWTIPAIVVSVGLLLDHLRKSDVEDCPINAEDTFDTPRLTPQYGEWVCGVAEEALGWYIYFPSGILLACNTVSFVLTVKTLFLHKRKTDMAAKASSSGENPTWVFLKLFIVAGVGWVVEFIGWGLRVHYRNVESVLWLIFFLDILNFLQSVAIFYIFVCKQQIFDQLWQKYNWCRPLLTACATRTQYCQNPTDKHTRAGIETTATGTLTRKIETKM